ncbi:MAG TPA: hypothetical protein VGI19_07165 [Candidatus Cybelea sp.]|jgi:hypothetical protein
MLAVWAWLALTGQTPATSGPPAAAAKPIRHLEYSFQVEYQTNGEGHSSGMDAGGASGVGSGVSSALGGGGRKGTMDVNVVGVASDGALIITIDEMLQSEPRPRERFTCTVYGDGHVMCATADGPLSDAENLLLSLLGRGFVDPQALDSNKHWRREYDGKQVTVVTDYTMADPGSDRPVTIVKHAKITSHANTVGDSVEDGRIIYDRALSVPDSVHDTLYETFDSGSLFATFDVTLTADSFAKH